MCRLWSEKRRLTMEKTYSIEKVQFCSNVDPMRRCLTFNSFCTISFELVMPYASNAPPITNLQLPFLGCEITLPNMARQPFTDICIDIIIIVHQSIHCYFEETKRKINRQWMVIVLRLQPGNKGEIFVLTVIWTKCLNLLRRELWLLALQAIKTISALSSGCAVGAKRGNVMIESIRVGITNHWLVCIDTINNWLNETDQNSRVKPKIEETIKWSGKTIDEIEYRANCERTRSKKKKETFYFISKMS